jgi:hypothetical protein
MHSIPQPQLLREMIAGVFRPGARCGAGLQKYIAATVIQSKGVIQEQQQRQGKLAAKRIQPSFTSCSWSRAMGACGVVGKKGTVVALLIIMPECGGTAPRGAASSSGPGAVLEGARGPAIGWYCTHTEAFGGTASGTSTHSTWPSGVLKVTRWPACAPTGTMTWSRC